MPQILLIVGILILIGLVIEYWHIALAIATVAGLIFWRFGDSIKKYFPPEPERREVRATPSGMTEIIVVGTEYYSGSSKLRANHSYVLTLKREPHNKHDRNAVAVLYRSTKVGYLSRYRAEQYKHLIDDAGGKMSVSGWKDGENVFVLLPRV